MVRTPRLPELDTATRLACDQVARRLALEAVDLASSMTTAVFDEVPEYAQVDAPTSRQAVFGHSLDHVHAITRAIESWCLPSNEDLAFVRTRASLRATQQMPLSALLHSYRLGHRTVWERLVQLLEGSDAVLEASLALTALTLAYTERISGVLADSYTERQRQLLLELDRDRRDLLERILESTFDRHSETARLASTFALVPGGDYLVIVLEQPGLDASPTGEALTRAAETLRRHLSLGVAQPFVVVRHAEIVSIAPLARARAAALAHLTRQTIAELERSSQTWSAGISTVCAGLGEIAGGYQEARQATEMATSGARVCALLDVRVADYLLARADHTALRMIPSPARRLLESAHADDRLLVETLEAYAAADQSIATTADRLAVHPNTVSYRLRKLGQRVERDVSRFSDLVEVLTWVRIMGPPNGL
jgi:hypothetical protein